MQVYNYNKDTKEYISTTQASENPLEQGKYLIPANATTIAISTDKDGFVQVFDEANQNWDYIEDNRGKTVYDTTTKQESKVDYLGAIQSGFTELVPSEFDVWNGSAWEVDMPLVIANKVQEINNACSSQIISGFTSTALDTATPTTYHYQSEQTDQLNLIGLVSGGVDDVLKCSKDDGSGNPTTWNYELHTIAQLTQVLNDGKAYKISLLTKAADLKAQANSIFVSVDGGLDGGYLTADEAKAALDSILW